MQLVHNALSPVPAARPVIPRDRLIRMPEVENITGLKKSAIYSLLGNKAFPKPVRLSSRCVAWPETAVLQWVQDRISESNTQQEVSQ